MFIPRGDRDLVKNYMIKDTDEEAGEDIQGEVWEGPKSRSFCFYGVRVHTFPVYSCIHQQESSQKPMLLAFYRGLLV